MKTRTILAAVVALLLPLSAFAGTEVVNGIEWRYDIGWTFDDDGNEVCYVGISGFYGYDSPAISTSTSGEIVVPSSLGGYPVTYIDSYAFRGCSKITSVTIPDSIESLGDYIFEDCTALERVVIGNGVSGIDGSTFMQMAYSSDGLKNLKEVVLGNGVTAIDMYAFKNCISLERINFPTSLERISEAAFEGCVKLREIELNEGLTYIDNVVFSGCTSLTSVKLPSTLEGIGNDAFENCTSLKSIEIPDSVTFLPMAPFFGCTSLKSAKLGDGLEYIPMLCFKGCRALANVEIGANVQSIEGDVFDGCTALKSMAFKCDVPTFGLEYIPWGELTLVLYPEKYSANWERALSQFGVKRALPLPDAEIREEDSGGKTWRYYVADGGAVVCSGGWGGSVSPIAEGESVEIPATLGGCPVRGIGIAAFAEMSGLSGVAIPDTVTNIADFAFYQCPDLESVSIPAAVQSLGDNSFSSCGALSEVSFVEPSSLARIGDEAFLWCSRLAGNFVLPSSNPEIGRDALLFTQPKTLSGSVNGTLEANSVYIVSNSISVDRGKTLTIPGGATLKFGPGASLTVSGTLEARGTRAQPIVFTSIKDDDHGGDTNGDGAATPANQGDWGNVVISGTAGMDYVSVLYSGGPANQGAVFVNSGGTASLAGCTIARGGDGIRHYGNVNAENTVIYKCSRGVSSVGGKGVFRNCVFDDCHWCVMAEGGAGAYTNCVMSGFYYDPNDKQDNMKPGFGVSLRSKGILSIANCVVWSDGDGTQPFQDFPSYGLTIQKTGCIEENPRFIDADAGNFRVLANSPCVDAGDGAAAPERDFYGRPRMDVSVVRDKGTAAANGNAPDIGIYEVDGDGDVPAPDLVVEPLNVPPMMTVGETVEIEWTVSNAGDEPAEGEWRDEIEIVSANGHSFHMGTFVTPATTVIAPGESRTFRETFRVPAASEGAVQVRVTANAYQDLFEAQATLNNAGATDATLTVRTVSISAGGTRLLTVPADADFGFALDGGSALGAQGGILVVQCAGELDAWFGDGSLAAKDNALRTAVQISDGLWLVQIPAGSEPRVTLTNEGLSEAYASLSLAVGPFLLFDGDGAADTTAVNSGLVAVPFGGNGFDDGMAVWIERNGVRVDAAEVLVESEVSARALFDVTGCETGAWTLCIEKDGVRDSAPLLALVEAPADARAKFDGDVDIPESVRASRTYVGTFRYGNSGGLAMSAPYVRLEAKGNTLIRLSTSDAWAKSVEFLAASDTYPASLLNPGAESQVTFFFKTSGGDAEIEYAYTLSSPEAFPWDDAKTDLRPSWASDELWDFAFATLRRNFGETWDSYLDRLRHDCDHLMKVGSPVKRLDRIWQLEINEALGNDAVLPQLASATDLARSARGLGLSFSRSYSSSLRGRLASGILGYGWTDNFSSYAEKLDDDTLVFHLPSGGSYSFTKVTGKWEPQDARDKTELTETGSEYVLKYASKTEQRFSKTTMKTSSIADSIGNTLSFTYSGGKLTRLSHSDRQSLSFTYSGPDGKLSKAQDDQGRTVKYAYSNGNLASVTAFDGLVTHYEYVSAPGTPRDKALSRIVHPDGTTTEFEYDDDGLLSATSANGGQLRTRIERGDFGCHAIVAPNGGTNEVVVGASGETLKTVNARGETVRQTYSAETLLESTISPSGRRSALTHDRDGNPVTASSASGATTTFSYEPEFGALASVTDAKGHAFRYEYDEDGRNVSVAYADGSEATVEYDEHGDMIHSTNRRGETVDFEYDPEGRLVKKTWPNGRRIFTLAYDAKGNVISASDSVTGTVTMEYDEKERMTRIVYPKGRGFTFEYDAYGRTVERASLDGTKECYEYDAFGRLSRVTDGDGNPYLENAYDTTTGWLVTQTYGNGTVVSNAYDELGRTIGIYHSKNGSCLAFFEYAYDEDGRCVSQTTAEGVETYAYDADGQLTAVAYPDGTSETFAYDAVGNRLGYTVNELNQYLSSASGETYAYDRDGNMTSRTDADGTTTYTYDTLNRLVAVTNATKGIRWSCQYDVFGNRVSVTDNGTTTEKVYLQGSLPSVAAEYVDGSLSTRHILVGAVRLASLTTFSSQLTTRFYHGDLIGSTRLLTDGTGATKGKRSFKAFGETRTSMGETTDAGYVGTLGIETDPTGLLFMRNRYYDAGMGRFVQMDSTGTKSGTINLQTYCRNNPVFYVDMSGFAESQIIGCAKNGGVQCLRDLAKSLNVSVYDNQKNSPCIPEGNGSFINETFATWKDGKPFVCKENEIYLQAKIESIAQEALLAHELQHALDKNRKDLSCDEKEIRAYNAQLAYLEAATGQKGARVDGVAYYSGRDIYEAMKKKGVYKNCGNNESKGLLLIPVVQSWDPNEIVGTAGVGAKRYVEPGQRLTYTIYFENKPEATAAAQEVTVVLPMDENLDWTTLELGEIAFGDNIDMGLSRKKRGTSNYANPGTNTFVRTKVSVEDGSLKWYIRDWDPTTTDNFPEDARGGFLPPNVKDEENPDNPLNGRGEGHVSFSVCVKTNAVNGTVINASANIQFDKNPWIPTNPGWFNSVSQVETVSFALGDGTETNLVLVVGEPLNYVDALPPDPVPHDGLLFGGWYTGPNGTGSRVTADTVYDGAAKAFYAKWAPAITLSPVYRFYSPRTKGHFYTMSEGEKDYLVATASHIWNYEGVAYWACRTRAEGTVPLYRFYSPSAKGHFYTRNEGEKDNLIATASHIWNYEGVAFYVAPSPLDGATAAYRFWAPRAKHHFYTLNAGEAQGLRTDAYARSVWTYEGIAFYAWTSPARHAAKKADSPASGAADAADSPDGRAGNGADEADAATEAAEETARSAGSGRRFALPMAAEGLFVIDGVDLEIRSEPPEAEELAAPAAPTAGVLALRVVAAEGTAEIRLWSAAEGTEARFGAGPDGSVPFDLPVNGVWHWLRARDGDGDGGFSRWLRAE